MIADGAPAVQETPSPRRPKGSLGRAVLVFFVFAIIGPPMGALVFQVGSIALGLVHVPSNLTGVELWKTHLDFFGLAAAVSYVFGGIQAAIVGAVAALSLWRRRAAYVTLIPVLGASAVTLIVPLVIAVRHGDKIPDAQSTAGFLAIHVGAGIRIYLLINAVLWLFRPRSTRAAMT